MSQLSSQEFTAVVDLFVTCLSKRGRKVSRKSNERFIKALFWMLDNGAKWRGLPTEFGKWNSIYFRFDSLSKQGVFEEFMQKLAQTSETSHILVSIDGSIMKASGAAAGLKKGDMSARLLDVRLAA